MEIPARMLFFGFRGRRFRNWTRHTADKAAAQRRAQRLRPTVSPALKQSKDCRNACQLQPRTHHFSPTVWRRPSLPNPECEPAEAIPVRYESFDKAEPIGFFDGER